MSVTGEQIRQELVNYGLILKLGQATATSGGASRFTDTIRLKSAALSSASFDGAMVRFSAGTATTVDGYLVRVDYLDQDNGDLYVTPSLGSTPDNTTVYEIFRPGLDPDEIDRLRDKALTKTCSQWRLSPVSLVTSADYSGTLSSNLPPGWTQAASGAAATAARQSGTFPTEIWRYSMLLTNASTLGRLISASIYSIPPGITFYLYVPVSVRSGTGKVIVRDVTNSADVTLTGTATSTRRGWTGIEVTGTIPATCDEIQVWLEGEESGAIVEWGPVFLHQQNQRVIALPDRVTTKKYVGSLYALKDYPVRTAGAFGSDDKREVMGVRREQGNDNVLLRFDNPLGEKPYVYQERMFFDALQTTYLTVAGRVVGDAATSLVDLDYITAALIVRIAEHMIIAKPDEIEFYTNLLQVGQSKLARFEAEFGPEPRAIQERDKLVHIPDSGA